MPTKRNLIFLFLLLNVASVMSSEEDSLCRILKNEIVTDLTNNILPFWEKYSPSSEGGFFGTILRDGSSMDNAPKGGILNARILWTFASAYRHTKNTTYRNMANYAYSYFDAHFINKQNGGIYYMLTAQGVPMDSTKQTAPLTYAIYALSEYAAATASESSLNQAKALYHLIESHAADSSGDGYFDSYDDQSITGKQPSKSLDTHLHIMEAYTNLYKVWPNLELKENLRNTVTLLINHFYQPQTGHLHTLFNANWEPIEWLDSYGHEVEAAWLLCEAANTLADETLKNQCKDVALGICHAVICDGISLQGAVATSFNHRTEKKDLFLKWWSQAEAVNAFIYAWKLTDDVEWLRRANHTWQFIKDHFIDYEAGEWFRTCTPDGVPIKQEPKGSLWNCPYHGSRMGLIAYDLCVDPN